jgi:uncharacterized hydrophobic protein (TIGR00271 family)
MPLKKDFFQLTKKEMQDTVDHLIETSAASYEFYMLFILAIIVTTLGVLINNAAIVIGGMLISPILSPTFSLGMGVSINDKKLIRRSLSLIGQIMIVAIILSAVIALLFLEKEVNSEIIARTTSNLTYAIIAMAAGVAGAYSYAKSSLSASFPGVAIAVAVLPPMVVMGIGIAFLSPQIFIGALLMFLVNFFSIAAVSIVVFSLLGFSDAKRYIRQKVDKEEEVKQDEEVKDAESNIEEIAKKLEKMTEAIVDNTKKTKQKSKK